MLSDADTETYKLITSSMNNVFSEKHSLQYSVGTAWETFQQTISGSDLDWIFDTANAFSLVLQVGTIDGTYWPDVDSVSSLVDKHLDPIIKFLQLSSKLPAKTTKKTANSSLLTHFNWVPLYLGAILFLIIGATMGTSWCLGYDRVWDRFKTWAKRMERKLQNHRKQYTGLRTTRAARADRGGSARHRGSSRNRLTEEGIGSSSGTNNRMSMSSEDDVLLEDLIVEDDDDEGA
ncbi:hypothetical protein HDU99_007941, partial [Rhizoclosmatium hyalinum]